MAPQAEVLPLLGDVLLSVPGGVAGPALAGRPSAPVGTNFAVYSMTTGDWLTDVVGLELTVGVESPFPRHAEVVLTRLSKDGKPVGNDTSFIPNGTVRERYRVTGFALDENAVVNFRHDEVQGKLVQMCSCPGVSGGVIAHRPSCLMRTVISDGR